MDIAKYAFEEFLEYMPKCDRFPTQESLPPGVRHVDSGLVGFIPPSLSKIIDESNANDSQVLIISAAGAVGKSTLAEAISYEKGALLWDLAPAEEVAGGSLDAVVLNTVAKGRTEEFFEYLSAGLQFLIIDALDEGRIKVNENSFRRLLENVGTRAKDTTGVGFVLLGRTRIAEEAWLVLSNAGVKTSILSIEPFNRDQANEYIKNRLGDHQHTLPYRDCRDLIFSQLVASVTEGVETAATREFVHYPPVLDVVATLLKEEKNPIQLKNSLDSQSSAVQGKSADLIQDVIVRILRREQHDKVLPAIKPLLGERAQQQRWSNWESLYSIEEQCSRLLESVLNISVPTGSEGSESLPDELRGEYEDSVKAFLDDHPFLQTTGKFANPVFQSYVFARALLGDFGDDLVNVITQKLLRRELLPTRLLAEFYLGSNNNEIHGRKTIMPEHLGILYDSLLSSESNRSHIRLNVNGPDPLDDDETEESGSVDGDFEILAHAPDGGLNIEGQISFSMEVDKHSEIRFSRYLRNVFVTVPCTIVLEIWPESGLSLLSLAILGDIKHSEG